MLPSIATPIRQCLDRLRAGDPGAPDDLIGQCQDRLKSLALQMFGGFTRLQRSLETENVLRGAAVRLDRCMRDISPETTREYLRLAALQIRRELIDLVNRYCNACAIAQNLATPPTAPMSRDAKNNSDSNYIIDAAQLKLWAQLHEQVQTLPEQLRDVFDLLWYFGMTPEEVAAELAVPLRTVQRQWLEARVNLVEHLPLECVTIGEHSSS